MSHSPPNYMDGVPVKISERFKPPPKITVPQSVINRLAHVHSSGGTVRATTTTSYDFELEATVLKRITEWRAAKERARYDREERVRLKEQERVRLAEEEQKRKLNQISYPNTDDLSSASEGEGEGSEEENDESSPSGSSEEHIQQNKVSSSVVSSGAVLHSHMNKFDTILMPTVLPDVATSAIGSTEKAIDPSKPLHFSIPKNTNLLNNNNSIYNKINYSDFENDTSSPFDNMELKTINDLDILAQVYNLDISNSGSERSPGDSNENDSKTQEKSGNACSTTEENEESVEQKATVVSAQSLGYQMQSHYQPAPFTQSSGQEVQSNDYYKSYGSYPYSYSAFAPSSTPSNTSYATPDSRFLSQYQSTAGPSYQQPAQSQYQSYNQGIGSYNYFPYTSSSNDTATQSTYASAYFYNSTYGHQSQPAPNYSNYSVNANATVAEPSAAGCTPSMETASAVGEQGSSLGSKSKSVPDIVRQLDEEVKSSAQRRTRNNSQSVADSNPTEDKKVVRLGSTQDFTLYNRLSPTDQNLVKRIGSMGFPLERVAAVLTRIGNDDKKGHLCLKLEPLGIMDIWHEKKGAFRLCQMPIMPYEHYLNKVTVMPKMILFAKMIRYQKTSGPHPTRLLHRSMLFTVLFRQQIVEHLIPLSELLDLGFEEEKISEALVKFDNNKHKALDYLIS